MTRARLTAFLLLLIRDGAGISGVVLVSYGAWLILPAAGFITGGLLLIAGAFLIALSSRSPATAQPDALTDKDGA